MRAPAKLNLHLTVGAVRPDGFHELTTVFQAVGLYDEVTVRRADELTVKVTGVGADLVPLDATNLAARAVCLLAVQTGHDPRVAIAIHKGIPVAGGCAGGFRTPPPHSSAATPCGAVTGPGTGSPKPAPSSAATCRSRCTAGRRSGPVAASS